jgi:L-alanine-DL-glutamate epimerase-like enolase superfamily enzyme
LFLVVKITDTEGSYGLGEITHGQFTHKPIIGVIEHFREVLKNTNIENINESWERMYGSSVFWNRQGLGIGVMGGINIAMYDLLGKKLKLPVYQLLGGLNKSKIRIYASNGLFEKSENLIKDARKHFH